MTSRIAWITGGGTGIGRALAEQLYNEGYSVLVSGRRKEVLSTAVADIARTPGNGRIWGLDGDVSDPAYVKHAAEAAAQRWGQIGLLINNAGVNTYQSFQQADSGEYADVFSINCVSAILCAKAVLPGMLAKRDGAIVNVSSILGKWASGSLSSYSVSKYALAGFTDSLRQELHGTGIHVMGVYPGLIRTPMATAGILSDSPRMRMLCPPERMAAAILRGLVRRKREVLYPWYVPWILRVHSWFPAAMERVRRSHGE